MSRETITANINSLISKSDDITNLFILEYCDSKKITNADILEKTKRKYENRHFPPEYQSWYSECILVLRIVLPERLEEFENQYWPEKNRKNITYSNYTVYDAICGNSSYFVEDACSAFPKLQTQINIILSLKTILESRLDNIQTLLQTDVFEEELASARTLFQNKFYRSSGALCGVLLEKHFQSIAKKASISIEKKNPTINDYNQILYEKGVLDSAQYKFVNYLADIRNKCDHYKKEEPTKMDIEELISGTNKVIETY